MIRGLSLARNEKSLYDFGLEIATRSGIIAAYRTENTPEATSALDNIEELLNSMQLFKEQRDAEIRSGERQEDEEATIDEWLQNVMLMTDMDKDDPEDRNKVTLMTVHSAKGLEYKYVYIVGLEENLFPSQRAAESPDGIEEERRLFYVALTRAKVEATISYAEMRFKWGNMEFSRPSCFLREIDPKYVRADFRAARRTAKAPRPSTNCAAASTTASSRNGRPTVRAAITAASRAASAASRAASAAGAAAAVSAGVPPTTSPVPPGASPAQRLRRARALRADPIRPSSRRRASRPTACAAWACGRRSTAACP